MRKIERYFLMPRLSNIFFLGFIADSAPQSLPVGSHSLNIGKPVNGTQQSTVFIQNSSPFI